MTSPLPDLSHLFPSVRETLTREYILGGASYRDVMDLSLSILAWDLKGNKKNGPICIATSSKSLVMAALLASLNGAPPLVLPSSLSDATIAETCKIIDASAVLTDHPVAVPKDVYPLVPDREATDTPARLFVRRHNKPFLWLYTGGSTGAPKLWPKTPENLIGEAIFLKKKFAIKKTDLFLAAVPPHHIYGLLFSVLLPFVSGACIADDIPYFPREIIKTALKSRCTVFIGSPMHYKALSTSSFRMARLRHAFSSGGFLEKSHSAHFSRETGTGVTEVYGSTETGGIATRCQTAGGPSWRPFSCVRWTIAKGKLVVSSPFLSPNLRTNKTGFFTTGDLASDNHDGTFALYGRADGIVKIGGKRVDLALIEQKIKSLPSISEAWVLSLPSRTGRENEVAALIVTKETLSSIRKAFAGLLEPTQVPRRIVRVRSIPLTQAGKRDHRAALSILSPPGKDWPA